MLNDSVGGEDVVEVAGGVVLLGRCVVGDPIPVDDKLQKGWQSACGRERRFLVEHRLMWETRHLARYGAG